MRALLLAGAALLATPATAQDHSGHQAHGNHTASGPVEQDDPGHEAMDHSQHGAMDHGSMDHSQHGEMDHSTMNHEAMDHGAMDHSQHGAMNHSQDDGMDHAGMDMAAPIPSGPPPAEAFEGPLHAADEIWGGGPMMVARERNRATHGDARFGVLMAERFEARVRSGEDAYLWDIQGWYGTPTDRVVLKSEGEGEFGGSVEDAEVQLLWGHAIGPWFDLQAGVRLDLEPDTTTQFALGVQGLAPYMIHVDAAAFLSDDGDLTARVEAEHDMRLTQRLVLQPRVEFDLAAQDIPARGVGAGLVKVETGLRLRYEVVPEFAPYIGVEYEAALGATADIREAAGDDPDGFVFLVGIRAWF